MANDNSRNNKSIDTKDIATRFRCLLDENNKEQATALVDALLESVDSLRQKNTDLELRVSQLLRRHVGRSSEKISEGQLSLFLDKLSDLKGDVQTPRKRLPKTKKNKQKKKGHGRRPLPEHLPREVVEQDLTEDEKTCSECGSEKKSIGYDKSETLEFVPAHFKVIEHRRKKYACKVCNLEVTRASSPDQAIEGSYAGSGLLAHILVSKYVDHLPLNRIRRIYLRSQVDLPASTLSDWVQAAARDLSPIAELIRLEVLASHLVQTDDTGLKVLQKKKGKGHNITKGHIWSYVGDSRYVRFTYTPTREGIGPQTFLSDYEGWLQADAYSVYDALFDPSRGGKAIEVACWAHARRYYYDLIDSDVRAAEPIALIRDLYAIEKEATENQMTASERLQLRTDRAPPILKTLGEWVAKILETEPPKSALYKAAQYTHNQWDALNRFLEDGRLPLDNTQCERSLRGIALGRRNYLFCGSDQGAHTAAIIYTLVGTCALNRIDPWSYIRDVITKLSSSWPIRRLAELLPPVWAQQHAEQANTH